MGSSPERVLGNDADRAQVTIGPFGMATLMRARMTPKPLLAGDEAHTVHLLRGLGGQLRGLQGVRAELLDI